MLYRLDFTVEYDATMQQQGPQLPASVIADGMTFGHLT